MAWVGTNRDIVEAREGQCRVRLMKRRRDADGGGPRAEVLPGGTIVTSEPPSAVSGPLTPAELDHAAGGKQ